MEMVLIPLFMKEEIVDIATKESTGIASLQTVKQDDKKASSEEKKEEGPISIDVIKDKWPNFLERIKKRKISLEAMLREARIVEIDQDGKLILGLPKTFSFLKERLEERPNRVLIEDEFKKLYGVQIQVKFVTLNDDNPLLESQKTENPKKEEKKISPDDVKNMFNGKIID